ncbi:MAG TPA: serine hydrolase [Flavilitoribacter sp.]|nr:serine hydrolase [Flavilitoribacter sp.]
MKLHLFTRLLSLFFLFYATIASCQPAQFTLKKGETRSASISAGQTHQYTLELKAGQYLLAEVVQNGIDLIIRAYDPKGTQLGEFDSPNGQFGPELISFVTKLAGAYRLDIAPLEPEGKPGKYTIAIKVLEKEATTPEGKVDQLFAQWNVPGSPGAAVAVVRDGKLHYSKGYGFANLEYDIPNSPTTVFHIASVSKQFTAFAIATLADQGKLSLDDDIRKYLPEMHDFGKPITIRQLAHHTSGLRDQWNLLALAGWRLDDVITREQILKLVFNQKELNFEPNAEHLYCNTGYTLMAEIVARVTEKPFPEWCRQHIFEPLGMKQTLFYDDHEKIVKNRAYSYYQSPEGFKKSVLSYANVGATSLFTTVEDLAKWAVNFKQMKVGNARIMAQMSERAVLNSGDTIPYALGQGIGTYKGLAMISHGGADAGYRTSLARFPDQDFAVIVFSNLASFNPTGLGLQVADIYLGDRMIQPKPAPKPDAAPKPEKEETAVKVDAAVLNAYVGEYELAPGFNINVTLEEGKLMGQGTGQPKAEMKPQSETTFVIPEAGATVIFEPEDNGKVNRFTLKQGGQEYKCTRIQPFSPASVDLSTFTGRFYSPELETAYTLKVEDGKLIAHHQRHPDIELRAGQGGKFTGNTWFFGQVEFDKNSEGKVTGMKVSSGRVRGVLFDKVGD